MAEDQRPEFIQVSSFAALNHLRAFEFTRPVNVYKNKRDRKGAYLIRIGWREGDRYSGHLYIVRCMTGELRREAEDIVREKLGFAPRPRSEP
jgi:hypothetical protein